MVDNIRGTILQDGFTCAGQFRCLGLPFRDFAILDHAWHTVFKDDETDGFIWTALADDFGCDVEVLFRTAPDENWVRDADETVIYTVSVDMLNSSELEIGKDRGG
jgi:hypothetical protein